MQTENEYFGTTLKIFENGLNFGDVLEKGGIKPSSTDVYKVSIIIIISAATGVVYSIPMSTPHVGSCVGVQLQVYSAIQTIRVYWQW